MLQKQLISEKFTKKSTWWTPIVAKLHSTYKLTLKWNPSRTTMNKGFLYKSKVWSLVLIPDLQHWRCFDIPVLNPFQIIVPLLHPIFTSSRGALAEYQSEMRQLGGQFWSSLTLFIIDITQLTFTCSKSTTETLEKGMKYVQSWQ